MIKQLLTLLAFALITTLSAQGDFPPAAGQPGSTAISKDSTIIQSWATGITVRRGHVQINDTSVYAAGTNLASFGQPYAALHMAGESTTDAVSLGDGGMATLTFDRLIVNGPGPDFAVFENSYSDTFLELAFVEVSSNGFNYSRFPAVSLTQSNTQVGTWGELDATNLHNLAGKYRMGQGTPFDLSDLPANPNIDVNAIRFVRIIDVTGSIDPLYASLDSQGNIINDPFPTPFDSTGFDLAGVALINGNIQNTVVHFNELSLPAESYYLPSADSLFTSGPLSFAYNGGEGFWSGFSYSNLSTLNDDYTHDQFASASLGGIDGIASNYAVSYISNDYLGGTYDPIPVTIMTTNGQPVKFNGFYVNNTHITHISMREGSPFNKKFGGETGNDPDWLRLKVWGVREDDSTTPYAEHYLADFRPRDNSKDYIQDDWRWVDLTSLGHVKELRFILESTDTGDYGMNTPAYFCMENLHIMELQGPFMLNPIEDVFVGANAAPVTIDLKNHFNASGATLTYQITENTDAELVTTAISGNFLSLSFTPERRGVTEITIAATANGISVEDTFRVAVGSELGTEEHLLFRPKVYPNPASDLINIEAAPGSHFRLYNSTGSLLLEDYTIDKKNTLSLGNLKAGIYLLQIISPDGSYTIKISKK